MNIKKGLVTHQLMKNETKQNQTIAKSINSWAEEILETNPLMIDKIVSNVDSESLDTLNKGLTETLRFLYLCSISNRSLTPSKRIDGIWHELILFTRSYHSFCHDKLGQFIHHQPTDIPPNENNQYLATIKLYQLTFGQLNSEYWTQYDAPQTSCGQCEI
jgi:hypothetical protein